MKNPFECRKWHSCILINQNFKDKARDFKDDAKKRLQLVLLHDRTDIPFEKLDKMKKEIFFFDSALFLIGYKTKCAQWELTL